MAHNFESQDVQVMMTRWAAVVTLTSVFSFWSVGLLAQVEFRKAQLVFSNGVGLTVEIADTAETQKIGLSGRIHLGDNEGMLFIFPSERSMSFWMRGTYIPLSIGFFNKSKELMSIRRMEPQILVARTQDLRRYRSERLGLFALEVNQGWFEDNKIVEGMTFELSERD